MNLLSQNFVKLTFPMANFSHIDYIGSVFNQVKLAISKSLLNFVLIQAFLRNRPRYFKLVNLTVIWFVCQNSIPVGLQKHNVRNQSSGQYQTADVASEFMMELKLKSISSSSVEFNAKLVILLRFQELEDCWEKWEITSYWITVV